MNLSAMPIVQKKEEEPEVVVKKVEPVEVKLMLFPSQIQKISSVIAAIAQAREKLIRFQRELTEGGATPLCEGHEWKTQFRYTFDAESKGIHIKA